MIPPAGIPTPYYVFDLDRFDAKHRMLREAFAARFPRLALGYSYKTAWLPAFCRRAQELGAFAEVVSRPQYINTQKEVILGRLLGQYDYGDGRPVEQDPYYMTFFDRQTNFPWKSHGIWWLTQFRRWGMIKEGVDYTGIVDRVHRPDIFREVAQEIGVDTPTADLQKETLFDGVEFDPAHPEDYARAFRIHNMV